MSVLTPRFPLTALKAVLVVRSLIFRFGIELMSVLRRSIFTSKIDGQGSPLELDTFANLGSVYLMGLEEVQEAAVCCIWERRWSAAE